MAAKKKKKQTKIPPLPDVKQPQGKPPGKNLPAKKQKKKK